jgi:hypothetical protein
MAAEFHPLAGPLACGEPSGTKTVTVRLEREGSLAALLSRLLSTRRCSHPIACPVGSLVTAAQAVRPCAAR